MAYSHFLQFLCSCISNESLPFYFLFGLSLLSFGLLCFFVDLKKSRQEQERFLARERAAKERRASIVGHEAILGGEPMGESMDKARVV